MSAEPDSKSKLFRGFDDEFEFYNIGERKIKINELSYNQTKQIKEYFKEFDKAVKQFEAKEISDLERIDKQDEFIENVLGLALSKEDYDSLLNDPKVSKPTLFGITRDLYTFLQVIGNKEELAYWQTLSNSTKQTTSESSKT